MTTLGWRSVFYICGVVGLAWSALWYLAYRNLPEEHGLVNKAELEHIRGIDEAGRVNAPKIETKTSVPWATLLRSPNMWAITCASFTYVYCLLIFLSWLPSYLVEFRHSTLLEVGLLASLPLWEGVVADTVGGLATDWLLKKTGNTKIARRAVAITARRRCFPPCSSSQTRSRNICRRHPWGPPRTARWCIRERTWQRSSNRRRCRR